MKPKKQLKKEGKKKKILQSKMDIYFWKNEYKRVNLEYSDCQKKLDKIEMLLPLKKVPVYYSVLEKEDELLERRVLNLIIRCKVAEKNNDLLREERAYLRDFIQSLTGTGTDRDRKLSDPDEPLR